MISLIEEFTEDATTKIVEQLLHEDLVGQAGMGTCGVEVPWNAMREMTSELQKYRYVIWIVPLLYWWYISYPSSFVSSLKII